MPDCSNNTETIEEFAEYVVGVLFADETDKPTCSSVEIWSAGSISKLNIALNGCWKVCGDEFIPILHNDAKVIYGQIYLIEYYEKILQRMLRGTFVVSAQASVKLAWTEVREGDSVIKRTSTSDMSKIMRDMLTQLKKDLEKMIYFYKKNRAKPTQVTGDDDLFY